MQRKMPIGGAERTLAINYLEAERVNPHRICASNAACSMAVPLVFGICKNWTEGLVDSQFWLLRLLSFPFSLRLWAPRKYVYFVSTAGFASVFFTEPTQRVARKATILT